jgi:hypothetical protein
MPPTPKGLLNGCKANRMLKKNEIEKEPHPTGLRRLRCQMKSQGVPLGNEPAWLRRPAYLRKRAGVARHLRICAICDTHIAGLLLMETIFFETHKS